MVLFWGIAVEGGDRLHLVVECKQSVSPEAVARWVKQRTTFDLWRVHAARLVKFYWGYYCGTVGNVSTSTVIEYVKRQKVI